MEEERYYEFTGETKKFYNRVVHRIRCTKDFRNYKAGDVGGWVEDYKNLGEQAWVEDEAVVCEYATVKGSATIKETAMVFGFAKVCGTATISGNAYVGDHAFVMDAEVSGNAYVGDCTEVKDNSVVTDHAVVKDNAEITDNARIEGHARVTEYACVGMNARVCDHAKLGECAKVGGCALVCDHAWLMGNTMVDGYAVVGGMTYSMAALYVTDEAEVRCEGLPGSKKVFIPIKGTFRIGGDAKVRSSRDYMVFTDWLHEGYEIVWTRSNDMWHCDGLGINGPCPAEEFVKKGYEKGELHGKNRELLVKYVESIKELG